VNQAYQNLPPEKQAEYNILCLTRLVCAAKKDCLHWIYEGMYEAESQGKTFPYTPEDAFGETYLTMLEGGPAATLKGFIKKEAIFVVAEGPTSLYLPPDLIFLLDPAHLPLLKQRFQEAMASVALEMRDIIEDYETEDEEEVEEEEAAPAPAPAPSPEVKKEEEDEEAKEEGE